MHVDLVAVRESDEKLRDEMFAEARHVQAICPIYKTDSKGQIITTDKANAPAFNDSALRSKLEAIKEELEADHKEPLRISKTDTKGISRQAKEWSEYAHLHPFLPPWLRCQNWPTS